MVASAGPSGGHFVGTLRGSSAHLWTWVKIHIRQCCFANCHLVSMPCHIKNCPRRCAPAGLLDVPRHRAFFGVSEATLTDMDFSATSAPSGGNREAKKNPDHQRQSGLSLRAIGIPPCTPFKYSARRLKKQPQEVRKRPDFPFLKYPPPAGPPEA